MASNKQWIGLALWIALCLGAAALGAAATAPQIPGWYATLAKPAWNPPAWVFGPVWTTLYLMMACAAWLVWRSGGFRGAPGALGLFLLQLALNAGWSWVFFGMQQPGWAVAVIVLLWCAIVATMAAFFRRSLAAGWLMAPYLAWVSFAAVLNAAIWRLNAG